ncbi:MAG TPA: FAD-dependent oxidoreductase [Kiloniellaceae bacterium]|nr:FAD-dependent oxidoreductase [Kiloniellaceae bacterium]
MPALIIIGTGLAGYTLAREQRKLDPITPLWMMTTDDGDAYSKPMLSNALAQGRTPETLVNADAGQMAEALNAEIRTHTRVTAIDPAGHSLTLDKGDTVDYRQLALAVGASPFRPPLKGDAADEVLSVNDLEDYTRFRQRLERARKVVILGPGLIGSEFANDLVAAGWGVAVVGPDPWPISTLLPEAVGKALQQGLADAGVEWHLGTLAESVQREGEGYRIDLASGESLESDLVLSAIGLRPNVALAKAAGLKVARGIVVDRYLRTSAGDVYALGDCAEVEGLNLPFVMPLMHGARALAKTLAGTPVPVVYPPMPVVIKTPACPVVVSPPARGAVGAWQVEESEDGVRSRFLSEDGRLLGFALAGAAVEEKQTLTRELPPVLA